MDNPEHHPRPCDTCKKNCVRFSQVCEKYEMWVCEEWRWIRKTFGVTDLDDWKEQ